MKKLALVFLNAWMGIAFWSCGQATDSSEDEAIVVPPGKEDNFLAVKAQEYIIQGISTVTIESDLASASMEEKLVRVRELIPLKQIVIGWFLCQYVGPKESQSTSTYGGFDALTKNGSYEEMDIQDTGDGLTFSFKFRQEVGGTLDLLRKLPVTQDAEGNYHFQLTIGIIGNQEMARLDTNYEWYRQSPWDGFDPSKVEASRLEKIDLTIRKEDRSLDGWIDYNALFADSEVTISVHFGWDYHNNYHLIHSKEIYGWLLSSGFVSPVSDYDSYTRQSGPLTKTFQANGKPVKAKVWLFWGKPGTETDPDTDSGGVVLENDMRESFRSREVIIFSGHSGPFYGFALANWRNTAEGDLDDSELPTLDMPQGVYQVVLAEGCETYGMGQGFWENPNKSDRKFLDVITTTSFSNAGSAATTKNFLNAFFPTDRSGGNLKPETFLEVLDELEGNSFWRSAMYGVHGIDNNPHLHPYADAQKFCTSCGNDSDCGAEGYKCARLTSSQKACFGRCTADDGCPEGYRCMDVANGGYLQWKSCVPHTMTCAQQPPRPLKPTLMINEFLADPPGGIAGDANGDGVGNSSQDEFVEIYNYGTDPINLSGWTVGDSTGTRFVFPNHVTLMAGEAIVVFGGGNPQGDFGGSEVFKSGSMLGLNNSGDTISLVAPDKQLVDQVIYLSEGGKDRALVRATDGDPKARFVQHPNSAFSPGVRQDGSPF